MVATMANAAHEKEEKRKLQLGLRQQAAERRELAEKKREEDKEWQLRESMELLQQLDTKQKDAAVKLTQRMEQERRKLRSLSQQELEKINRHMLTQASHEEERRSVLTQRILKREESVHKIITQKEKEHQAMLKQKAEEEKRRAEIRNSFEAYQTAKKEELKARLAHADQLLMRRRKQEQLRIELRSEERRLRQQDAQQNFERLKKIEELRIAQLREKARQSEERIGSARSQQYFIQKSNLETELMTKIEKERIDEGTSSFATMFFSPFYDSQSLGRSPMIPKRRSLHILKSLLPESDIEREFFRKEPHVIQSLNATTPVKDGKSAEIMPAKRTMR
eukprot:TRINITY_DN9119_c0_g1_i4.p1 TRINITY_DN9119_c0_g1~~TRINITY_DN9119_c0_g1_i4.p1  ORF type:complete len:336 (+),score=106.33 TRINITY_DN9119_c0_g1_i4:815-1822(+)